MPFCGAMKPLKCWIFVLCRMWGTLEVNIRGAILVLLETNCGNALTVSFAMRLSPLFFLMPMLIIFSGLNQITVP